MKFRIYRFRKISSTNDKAKEFIKKNICNAVIVADMQTKGRGRFGRKWHSSKDGLWFSIILRVKEAKNLQCLTFISAIAVVKCIKQIFGVDAEIKWPNDVIYSKKKLCGILTEGIFGNENYAIIGIGINLNQSKFPEEIRNIAISIKQITKKKFSRKILFLNQILTELEKLYLVYKKDSFEKILTELKKNSSMIGKDIKVKTVDGVYSGKAIDIDNNGALVIKTREGKIKKIIEGDVLF